MAILTILCTPFNLGVTLLRQSSWDEAAKHLNAAAEHDASDDEAETLLAFAQDKTPFRPGSNSGVPPEAELRCHGFP